MKRQGRDQGGMTVVLIALLAVGSGVLSATCQVGSQVCVAKVVA